MTCYLLIGSYSDELTVDSHYIENNDVVVAVQESCIVGWCALARARKAGGLITVGFCPMLCTAVSGGALSGMQSRWRQGTGPTS